MSESPA
ncbi:hypothetical protein F383_33080 [Gossypium arboreum]|nr:hypothetical protein F383_33080 [Gossypium arboreum]